jgi:hypothetical protein
MQYIFSQRRDYRQNSPYNPLPVPLWTSPGGKLIAPNADMSLGFHGYFSPQLSPAHEKTSGISGSFLGAIYFL